MAQLKSTSVTGNLVVTGSINGGKILENGATLSSKYLTTHLYRPIRVGGTEILSNGSSSALTLQAGSNVQITNSNGTVTISASGGSGGGGSCVKIFAGSDLLSNFGAYVSSSYNTYLITLSSAYYYELDDSGPAYLIVTKTSDSYYCMLGTLMYTDTEIYNIHAYCQWIGNSRSTYSDTIDPDGSMISEIYGFA